EHVQAVREFLGAGASLRKGIFLADGDALMTPQPRLRECIGVLRETYPALPLYSFMDAFRPQAKSAAEFSELAQLGLKRVYLGIETGDAALLQWLAKPGNPQLMQAEAAKIKAAGLALGLIFMVGAGGRPYAHSHRQASTAWLQQLPLDREDFVFLSEFIPHRDQPYTAKAQAAGIEPFTPAEMKAEIAAWRTDLQGLSARLVPYHLREFVY
ncbi:MAG: radical SAM protein, partial [Candidatus Sericytochromatia bacterium]